MKRDEVKNIVGSIVELTDEQAKAITDNLLNAFNSELEAEKENYKNSQEQLKEAQATIRKLENNKELPDEVKQQLNDYKVTVDKLNEEIKNRSISEAESIALVKANAHDIGLCQKALSYDRNSVKSKDDYGIIDDAVKALKKEKSFLFAEEKTRYEPRTGTGKAKISSIGKEMAESFAKENSQFSITGVKNK